MLEPMHDAAVPTAVDFDGRPSMSCMSASTT